MDVIALARPGFGEAVAPLGTALTEDQVQAAVAHGAGADPVLRRRQRRPQGRLPRRRYRAAAPQAGPQRAVRVPARRARSRRPRSASRAPRPCRRCSSAARPLFDMLWNASERAGSWPTPERRALARARGSRRWSARIGDAGVRGPIRARAARRGSTSQEPQADARSSARRRQAARAAASPASAATTPARLARRAHGRSATSQPGRPRSTRPPAGSNAAQCAATSLADRAGPLPPREALLLRALLNHPWLLEGACEAIAALTLTSKPLTRLRDALLALHVAHNSLDTAQIQHPLTDQGLAKILPSSSVRSRTKATSSPNQRQIGPTWKTAGVMPCAARDGRWAAAWRCRRPSRPGSRSAARKPGSDLRVAGAC